MTKHPSLQFLNPNAFLLLCLIVMIFFVPMFPVEYHGVLYQFLFSCVFVLSALSLQHVQKKILVSIALFLTIIIWIADKIDLAGLHLFSRAGQGIFFVFIVVHLIRQTATAKNVGVRVIADSINGYLLVGIIYSIVVLMILRFHPDAYHFPDGSAESPDSMSQMLYYTFITFTSTGYGDIFPKLPGARSFATLISTTGQLYVAIIIALLVGKFSSTEKTS